MFAKSKADIIIYGGQAGGGKSFALVAEPLRHIKNPGFRGAIFRRTSEQITGGGGLWDEACKLYPIAEGTMRGGSHLDARFPSGASISFEHLQHEKTKYEHQGKQYAYLGFDEVTHLTQSQFLYMLSRNRSTCGIRPYVRCTCNPDATSWVKRWVDWWIDPATGFPIPERSGVIRFVVVVDGEPSFGDSPRELVDRFPNEGFNESDVLTFTFIPATLDDNPELVKRDPGYRARLKAQPRIERERLEKGNWNAHEGSLLDPDWFRRYELIHNTYRGTHRGQPLAVPVPSCRRFATIDTAGTSKERAAEARGDPPSHTAVAVWDYYHKANILFLAYVWRKQADWNELKIRVQSIIDEYRVPLALIENAHFGQALSLELKGVNKQLIPTVIPGMDDGSRGAKLERAIASGLLSRVEDGLLWIPGDDFAPWVREYFLELSTWDGLPKSTADQVDVSSHACYWTASTQARWGGVVK